MSIFATAAKGLVGWKGYALTAIASSLIAGGLSGYAGWKLRDADYQKHLSQEANEAVKAQQVVRTVEATAETISQGTRESLASETQKAHTVYRTIVEKVPVYVTQSKAEARLVADGGLPAGFVWNFNQSASGDTTLPLPPGTDRDTPTGVDLSTLARVSAGNHTLYHECNIERGKWREWHKQQSKLWPVVIPSPASK